MKREWQAAPGMMVYARQAVMADMPCIMQVEQSWGEAGRAEEGKFIARITKFPQGCLIVFEEGTQRPIATITSCPTFYDGRNLDNYSDWNKATNRGFFSDDLTCDNPLINGENALYVASGIIDNDFRGADIFSHALEMIVELGYQMGVQYVIAGAVIPGYKRYCEKFGDISAPDYVNKRRGSSLADPLLSMYEKIGFHVPDANHVIAEYFPDDASLNYAALVVRKLS